MSLHPGQSFAGYRIVRQLGAGGMGEVYLADHPRLPRQDALKILPTGLSADPMFRKRFTREADIAATLDHPNVVSVFDRGESDGQLWITMKFVDGTDASQLLQTHPRGLPAADVVAIISAVAEALDHAHQQGLLHRDVKPANILIAEPGPRSSKRRILLADFGIARPIFDDTHITSTNLTVGSVAYTSPEQLSGSTLDGRADQYSLACTAYQLLCGATPFANSNAAMLIHQHLSVEPPAITGKRGNLSAQVDRVLARALDKEPRRRFDSCEQFADELASALRTDAAAATLLSPGPPPATPRAPSSPPPSLQKPRDPVAGQPSSPVARPVHPTPAPTPAARPVYPTPAPGAERAGRMSPAPFTPAPAPYPGLGRTTRSDGKATASLVLGIVSIVVGWCGFGLLMAPLAIILGLISLRESDRLSIPTTNRGAAIGGVITGIIGFLLVVAFIVFAVVTGDSTSST
ncbi:serine/threonine-protein kinase [Gordonia bronchialis]|uniref:serine/threonine-protein kinase n=1 Tax=Gordonia bronchialis TaxID=2054 RepID=UPI00242D92BE|nr:serine/threonine-protein kinase [Gordonia bronchialis]